MGSVGFVVELGISGCRRGRIASGICLLEERPESSPGRIFDELPVRPLSAFLPGLIVLLSELSPMRPAPSKSFLLNSKTTSGQ